MTPHRLDPVLRHVRNLGGNPSADLPDGELLARFVADRDEAAFAAIVRRHGPMILGLCRRLLGDVHAAEDAFQATFLLLAKKARRLRQPDRLGPWLYGVARRVALKARSATSRRREVAPVDMPAASPPETHDLRPAIDAAISRLPARYRLPVVLCYLQGLTYAEAAERLRCPSGTVATRLSRARDKLRVLLVRQGVVAAAGALTASLTPDAMAAIVPDELLRSTARWAAAVVAGSLASIPAPILTLSHEVAQTMILDKLKVLAMLVILGVAGTGAGVALSRPAGREPPAKPDAPLAKAVVAPDPAIVGERSLPMAMLRQKPPAEYRVDSGDVLGLFIEGVLGDRNTVPPITNIAVSQAGVAIPTVGYPILVQEDGTISLPLLEPLRVQQMSVGEVRRLIAKAYQDQGVTHPGARILVSVAKPRTVRVTVVRAKSSQIMALDLPAYENDVLTALARSGGLSYKDDILVIQRGSAAPGATAGAAMDGIQYIRIPLKLRADQPLPFKPEDVILKNGDVLTFESSERQPAAMSLAVSFQGGGDILVYLPNGGWRRFDKSHLTATEIDGKPVADMAERLKAMTTVLLAWSGRPPTGKELENVRPGTLVLTIKD